MNIDKKEVLIAIAGAFFLILSFELYMGTFNPLIHALSGQKTCLIL